VVFCKLLMVDIMATLALQGIDFALINRTWPKLENMEKFSKRMLKENGVEWTVLATLECREAIADAGFIVVMIRWGCQCIRARLSDRCGVHLEGDTGYGIKDARSRAGMAALVRRKKDNTKTHDTHTERDTGGLRAPDPAQAILKRFMKLAEKDAD